MPRKQLLRWSRQDKTLNKGDIKFHKEKGKRKEVQQHTERNTLHEIQVEGFWKFVIKDKYWPTRVGLCSVS